MSKKYLYYFSEGSQAFGGDKTAMRNILGGKGSGLAEMTAAGMPVPQGFTITTEACTQYYADGRQINAEIQADIFAHVKGLEELTGKKLGDVENPLLASFNTLSGVFSMPYTLKPRVMCVSPFSSCQVSNCTSGSSTFWPSRFTVKSAR